MALLVQEMLRPQLVSTSLRASRLLVGKERGKGEKKDSPFILFLPSYSSPFLSHFPSSLRAGSQAISEWATPKIPRGTESASA